MDEVALSASIAEAPERIPVVEGDVGSNTSSILHKKTLLLGDPISEDESVKKDGDEVPQIPPAKPHDSEDSKEVKPPSNEAHVTV